MPKQRTTKAKEVPMTRKWIVSFNERHAYLTCPVCKNTINYNIVMIPARCDKCNTILEGMKENG